MPASSKTSKPRTTSVSSLVERGSDLMLSISGIRGTIPQGLDPANITHFALAFSRMTGKRIVIGRDSRPTGEALQQIFTGVLRACGKDVVDVGLAPTPTIKAAVSFFEADAGVIVSASHNPLNYNGFKFLGKGGFFFSHKEGARFLEILKLHDYKQASYQNFGGLSEADAISEHVKAVVSLLSNVNKIRKKKYRVVVDAVGGAGQQALPLLLEELGCQVIRLYCDESPGFPRPPEPTPKALREFGRLIQKEGASVGFALDPDADRLVCGSPEAGPVHEEYTLPLAFFGFASKAQSNAKGNGKAPALVVNLSTSRLLDRAAAEFGYQVRRSAVGEANVVALMKRQKALFGGEGNGGIIHAGVPSFGRDSLTGAALILSAMAERDAVTLDGLLADLPPLFMKKEKLPLPASSVKDSKAKEKNLEKLFEKIIKEFPKAKASRSDGLYLDLGRTGWLHLRASNTEPILRLIAEGESPKALREISSCAKKALATS